MSLSSDVTFGILFAFSYLFVPIVLFWGWARWIRQPRLQTVTAILPIGFILATAPALLGVLSIVYRVIHRFPYYDPLLLRIFRVGALLSLGGIGFGVCGVWRPGSLRWHAPASAIATLAFWIVARGGE